MNPTGRQNLDDIRLLILPRGSSPAVNPRGTHLQVSTGSHSLRGFWDAILLLAAHWLCVASASQDFRTESTVYDFFPRMPMRVWVAGGGVNRVALEPSCRAGDVLASWLLTH